MRNCIDDGDHDSVSRGGSQCKYDIYNYKEETGVISQISSLTIIVITTLLGQHNFRYHYHWYLVNTTPSTRYLVTVYSLHSTLYKHQDQALSPAEMLKLELKQSSRSSFILIGITAQWSCSSGDSDPQQKLRAPLSFYVVIPAWYPATYQPGTQSGSRSVIINL